METAGQTPNIGRDVTRGEQLDAIARDLDATGAAWEAAGYPSEGPEFDAREAVFARLHAWNEAGA